MFRRLFNDIKKYFHYSVVSAKSQLKAEVANSYLNWICAGARSPLLYADLYIYFRIRVLTPARNIFRYLSSSGCPCGIFLTGQ